MDTKQRLLIASLLIDALKAYGRGEEGLMIALISKATEMLTTYTEEGQQLTK